MNNIFKIPAFQRRKAIPKQLKDLELLPLNEQFSKLTMSIVGDDDMRPVMTGNFFDMENKKIVSTDAHKLTAINMPKDTFNFIEQKYNKELDKEPKGLIFHTLSQLQKDYNSLMKNNNITISFDEFISGLPRIRQWLSSRFYATGWWRSRSSRAACGIRASCRPCGICRASGSWTPITPVTPMRTVGCPLRRG